MIDVTVNFFNDGPGPACLEYSYISSGQRRDFQLLRGTHAATRVDSVNPSDNLVQVYTVQTEGRGASWDGFPVPAPKSSLATVIFQIRWAGPEVVGTVYYADGTSYSETKQLQPTRIPCPTGL
jgi:hypothetical protein